MPSLPPVQMPQPEENGYASSDLARKAAAFEDVDPSFRGRVYDPQALRELQEIFGRPKLMDLLGRLKVEIAQRLHAPATERAALGQDAHTLLSVSGSLGFVDLSRRCMEMEQAFLLGADLATPLDAARLAAVQAIAAIDALEAGA